MEDVPIPLSLPGTVNGAPLTHDYWKRAVYRAAPKLFSVEMLPPEKQGSQYSYGMRISPVMSSAASTRSSFMNTTYDIWRRWDDCLWFQDMVESEYSVISQQKRKRLLEGKGVKKNGIYIQDRASSWESLPPGPDPKSIKKDVHEHLPKLTKRGSIFRTSMATVEQRAQELRSLVEAFLADDVPGLIQDLRDNRAIRDFFGFWRRDHDLLLKRRPPLKPSSKGKESRVSTLSGFSFHLSPSSASVSQYPDVPSSPSASTFAPSKTSSVSGSFMADTTNTSSPARPRVQSSAASVSAASHAGSSARRGFSRGPSSEASGSTFKTKHVPDIHVVTVPPPNVASPSAPSGSGSSSSSSSSGTYSQSGYTRSRSASVPRAAKSYDVSEDFPLFLSSSTRDAPAQTSAPQRPSPSVPSRPRLEALPEEHELDAPSPVQDIFEPPETPSGRRRAQSLGGASNRTTAVFEEAFPQPASNGEPNVEDVPASSPEHDRDSTELNPGLISSAATLSTASLQSRRSSWRTTRSRPSSAGSAVSGMSNIDIDLSSFIAPSTPPDYYAMLTRHPRKASIITVDSADAVIPRYLLDPEPEPEELPQEHLAVPQERQAELRVDVRRSMSGRAPTASRRMRPRSNSQPVPHTPAATDERFSMMPPEHAGSDSGMELGDEFYDAYFTPESQRNELYSADEYDNQHESFDASYLDADPNFILVPEGETQDLDVPQTPHTPLPETPNTPLNTRRQQVAMSLSSELFHQPFRSAHSSRVSGLSAVQFHLPFTPPAQPMPELPPFPTTPTTPLPPLEQERALSVSPPTSPADDNVVVKAVCGDIIVQFRMPRSTCLYDARTRVADKFTSTEGMQLASGFALAYVPPLARGQKPTHGSAVSAASGDWSRQVVIGSEDDWSVAVHTCGPKLVLRIGEAGSP